ncbi:MAG: RNA methyltransferase [Lachnospiraceae bacterium]|nr:RNA methyltransferase [Lachnospiraceae bacterium]
MNFIKIKDFENKELDIYARLTEKQLLHINEPKEGLFIAESPKVIMRALDAGYEPVSLLIEEKYLKEADAVGETKELLAREELAKVPVFYGKYEVLTKLTGFALTRGALCAMRRKPLLTLEEICRNKKRIAILEEVVNPTNVGAIIRSAAALKIEAVILTAGCSDPLYRRAARVSMGTVFQVPWTILGKKTWPQQGMKELNRLGFKTVSMALTDKSIPVDDLRLKKEEKLAIILGTEGDGLLDDTISDSDYTVRIPMEEGVDSLNVAAASAVVFWELRG